MENIIHYISTELPSVYFMVLVINALIHLIFAGAVARDAGKLAKDGHPTYLVSPVSWAFATLVGGVFVAAIYWFMHHLNVFKH